jgi:hypothetical protein
MAQVKVEPLKFDTALCGHLYKLGHTSKTAVKWWAVYSEESLDLYKIFGAEKPR